MIKTSTAIINVLFDNEKKTLNICSAGVMLA